MDNEFLSYGKRRLLFALQHLSIEAANPTSLRCCDIHHYHSNVVSHELRSHKLLVPSTRRATLGDRAFPVAAAARAWNSLPAQTTTASSLITFRRQTKAYVFRQLFG